MAEFKVVISTKKGISIQKELKDSEAKPFLGKKIGNIVKGDAFGMAGYEFKITGGSDSAGFPMRKDLDGTGKKKILTVSGVGVKKKRDGQRQRKTVAGNTVHAGIAQINCKVTKEGKEKIGAPAEEPKAEEKADVKPAAPKEAPKEEKPKKEAPKEEKPVKEVKPKEETKKEAPKEEKPVKEVKPKEEPKKEVKPKKEAPKEEKPVKEVKPKEDKKAE